MKIFALLASFMLASVSMASNTDQTRNHLGTAGMPDLLDTMEATCHNMLKHLRLYRNRIATVLMAIGAEKKTAAEWREQWTREGKTERIARYLTGKDDNARLWYLSVSKADAEIMAAMGMGDIRIGYIEHWHKFNELVDEHNAISKKIFTLSLKNLAKGIKETRERVEAHNEGLGDLQKSVAQLKKHTQEARDAVSGMITRVETQNLGLSFVLAFMQGLSQGLNELDQAQEDLGSN